ncbi:UNVERIFIED_CONTAM: hypothetical protein Cloal_0907 [Acetivibrio alkalicellulosi]
MSNYKSEQWVHLGKSDSAREICKKAEIIDQLDKPFREITSVYERVKYGDEVPDINQLDDTKNKTVESIKIIKKWKMES